LISLGHNFQLGRIVKKTQAEVNEAQIEVDKLAPIIAEVEQFKAKKAKLENKVNIISQLKNNQQGPVQIMDEISRALPELLWMDRMQVSGQSITLTGRAFNTNAVANFLENLDRVPQFQEPVLQDTSQAGQTYSFVIRFSFTHVPEAEGQDRAAAAG
jgi:type IV pilus assembly protein PilN